MSRSRRLMNSPGEPADCAMEYDIEKLRGIIDRESGRLLSRAKKLRQMVASLVEDYPTARQFADEVQSVAATDETVAARLRRWDWEEELVGLGEQLKRVFQSGDSSVVLELDWHDDLGLFIQRSPEPAWRTAAERPGVDVAELVDRLLETGDDRGKNWAVSYPIIFSHQAEANHRAVARAIGWAAVKMVSQKMVACEGEGPEAVHFYRDGREVSDCDACDFGYSARGELVRRIEAFEQVDPGAHWVFWMKNRESAPREVRELQEQAGTRIAVEVERPLRRLRVVESPPSKVVRKRHTVFVDACESRRRDRYFATEEALDKAVEDSLRRRIADGFRIVYERLETDGEVCERRT